MTPEVRALGNWGVTLPPDRAGFTVTEVATMLAISQAHVYVMMDRGELISFHIGRKRRITADSIRDYITRQVATDLRRSGAHDGGGTATDRKGETA